MDFWLNKYPRHIFFAFQYIYRVRLFRSKERIRNCRTFDFLLSSKLTTLDTFRSLSCDEIKGTDIFIIILETLCPEYSMNAKQEIEGSVKLVRSSWERARIDFMLTIYRRFSYLFFFLSFLACNISCETDHDRLTIVLSNQIVRFCFERNERLFVFIDKIKRKLLRMLAIICEKKKVIRVVYNREPSKEEVGRSVNGEIVGQ